MESSSSASVDFNKVSDISRQTTPEPPAKPLATPPRGISRTSSINKTPTQASVLAAKKLSSKRNSKSSSTRTLFHTAPSNHIVHEKALEYVQDRLSVSSKCPETKEEQMQGQPSTLNYRKETRLPKEQMVGYDDFVFIAEEPLETCNRHFKITPDFHFAPNAFFLMSREIPLGHRVAVTGLDMVFNLYPGSKSPYIVSRLHEYLCERDPSQLYLYFRFEDWTLDNFLPEFLKVLRQHVDRFKHIDLQTNENFAAKFFAILEPTKAVNLERLKFDTRGFSKESTSTVSAFINALPSVRELVYPYDKQAVEVSQVAVWSNLSSVNIADVIDEVTCIAFLRQCTRATHITVQCVDRTPGKPTKATRIERTVLPLLQFLDIAVSHIDTTAILDHFTCPALESLEFVTVCKPKTTADSLKEFLGRCGSPLRLLNIFDHTADLKLAIPLIRAVLTSASGLRHDERTRVETFGLFTSSLPTDSKEFFKAWYEPENQEGNIDIEDLQYWCGGMDNPQKTMRVGWGASPLMLNPVAYTEMSQVFPLSVSTPVDPEPSSEDDV